MTNEGKELRMHGMQIGTTERIQDLESEVPVHSVCHLLIMILDK